MIKSNIAVGQMFVQFPQPIAELQDDPKPRVWVKIKNETMFAEEVSLFVDNRALVQFSINRNYRIGIHEKWNITDRYYEECVQKGAFVPISDLNEVDAVCERAGYPAYEIDIL